MASAYPGWESLAWGAVRFLLTAGIKYQKLKEKVEVCLGQIGENFKKISSFSKIYPTEQIVQHVCGAYSEFVKFLENAVRFYKDSKLSKFPELNCSDWLNHSLNFLRDIAQVGNWQV